MIAPDLKSEVTPSRRLKDALRHALTLVGRRAPTAMPWALTQAANYLETGRRLRALGIAAPPPVRTRFEVFDAAIADAARATRPVYLEFGVWQGETINYWQSRLPNPEARLFGFDSFEGLPEDWNALHRRGAFSVDGAIPKSDDPRVEFVKGWFDATLADFELPPNDRLVVNVDSDLYGSAVTVLTWAAPYLRIGDLLYFDEFHERLHEGRAFEEYLATSGHSFQLLASTPGLVSVLFRRVA